MLQTNVISIPAVPLRGMIIFPSTVVHIDVGREQTINSVKQSMDHDQYIFAIMQKDPDISNPSIDELYKVGTLCKIKHFVKLSGGTQRLLIEGVERAKIIEMVEEDGYYKATVETIEEDKNIDDQATILYKMLVEAIEDYLEHSKKIIKEIFKTVLELDDPYKLLNMAAFSLPIPMEQKQELLDTFSLTSQFEMLLEIIHNEKELLEIEKSIHEKVRKKIDKTQKEYFLREQLKVIQSELSEKNGSSPEIARLKERIEKSDMTEKIREVALNELTRISMMQESSAEFNVGRSYLEWLITLPWQTKSKETLDVSKAEKVLNNDHYGLELVKERILEYIAVLQLTKTLKGPILCLVGPPGVGKTSLARSISKALNRNYVRVALGGVRDESEIRGHRRTYLGALPGRIISSMKKAGTVNPLFLLDEIDKMTNDFRGDPFSAMLEVLDPEQNKHFSDHYIEESYDLSNVMFVATANSLSTVPGPLLDRMEIIELSGYTEQEKLQIAKKYLLPKQISEHGLPKGSLVIKDDAILAIIRHYTREAGVRTLERTIAKVCRKSAKSIVSGEKKRVTITDKNITDLLGSFKFEYREKNRVSEIGVATGLAYTQFGGDILSIEVNAVQGKGKLTLTGKLGDVMKESAQAALSYVRSKTEVLKLDKDFHEKFDLHIHVPEGAVPKDGPSAGITMATAIISALSNIPVRKEVGMTGEITLRGRVLPIGGLREKIMSAHRSGLTTIIFPKTNEKDLEKIPENILKELKLHAVEHMDEVLGIALEDE
jgi:ATP-dependent Lon protease